MKPNTGKKPTSPSLLLLILLLALSVSYAGAQQMPAAKNIVIVHGAFADASGWENVYQLLSKKGYRVSLVQNPLSSLANDVEATKRVLDRQDGPTILVGHSWGGTVITEAGMHEKVVALVYVAAFVPAPGETTLDMIKTASIDPDNGILPADKDGYVWYDKAKFHKGFCADVPKEKAEFMFASHAPILGESFVTKVNMAAWQSKPSFAIVAKEDKSINPDLERRMYKRAGSTVVELSGSHVLFITQAKSVAAVIETASRVPVK